MQPFKYNPNNHSGKFNNRITFREFISDSDKDGFPIEHWVDIKSVWAMIKTVKGSEYFGAATTQNENAYRFVIRYTQGLHPDMKLVYKGRNFEIESILNDDELNKTLTIVCKEVV